VNAMTTCAVVLAAGRSRRMGKGVQKLLLPLGGTTVVGRVVDELLRSELGRVIVVAGPDGRIAQALDGRPVTLVTNPDPEADMLDSVRCGLRALPAECDAVLVALGDQPGLTSGLVNEMLRAYAACGRGILVPVHAGRRGHPLLFSTRYRDEVLTRFDGEGLRALPKAHPEDVLELPVAGAAILEDVDDPGDYLRALRADSAVQSRVDELAEKSTSGTLTGEERSEYEAYVAASTFIAILQAKARNRHGGGPPVD
jgi:molybdenum cofactor cytidylyltransferase